ncbi:MAG: translocation/assembly module TamB [Bacteroidaceae bacterium]|nr:translocation/assembly module TamB [Bacteroidaceae bacterium]
MMVETLSAHVEGTVTPSDLSSLLPALSPFTETLSLHSRCSLADNHFQISELSLSSPLMQLESAAAIRLPNTPGSTFSASADVNQLRLDATITNRLTALLSDAGTLDEPTAQMLNRLGSIDIKGTGAYAKEHSEGEVELMTSLGNATLSGSLDYGETFEARLTTDNFQVSNLFETPETLPLDNLSLSANAEGNLREKNIRGSIGGQHFLFKGELVDLLQASFDLNEHHLGSLVTVADDHYSVHLQTNLNSEAPFTLEASTLDALTGTVNLDDLSITNNGKTFKLENLNLDLGSTAKGNSLKINGDFIHAEVNGQFSYLTLGRSFQHIIHKALPSLIPLQTSDDVAYASTDVVDFNVTLSDADSLFSLLSIDCQLPQPLTVQGHIDNQRHTFNLNADLPHVKFAGEELKAISLIARQQGDYLHTFATLQRWPEDEPVDITLTADAENDALDTFLTWDNNIQPSLRGQLSAKARFILDNQHRIGANIHLSPSQIIIADTVWNVHGADLHLHDGSLAVNDFEITQQGRHLQVNGVVSPEASDTLFAHLRGINLEYVFGLLDFHDVEFAGSATGTVTATLLTSQPVVNAALDVSDFHFEHAPLGQLHVTGGWGRVAPGSIDLDAYITEPEHLQTSHVFGTVTPGHDIGNGLNLDIEAHHLSAGFISDYTRSIFSDFQGRATGHARIYGPFSELELQGALSMDTLALTIPVLGTRYHSLGGDSVWLRPEGVFVQNFKMYDRHLGTDGRAHQANITGALRWQHFDDINYDFDISANNFLGYDFQDFGDEIFYGTVFAEGTCRLFGNADHLNVELHGQPAQGSVFTYNASTPETLTNNEFITFKKREAPLMLSDSGASASNAVSTASSETSDENDEPLDIRISFDMQVNPQAQMRLLMDPRSEDYITLFGSGTIRANYYNKGRFEMYGTYRVDHGDYRLSLQDVIRKDFQFQQGGTITFSGAPMRAGLDLTAVYTVPSVSLNDLASGSNFPSTNVRVNCLMNISGQAEQPQVSFDFDIPNVNEDVKQMVRSLISTDEERNLQVIYLLGLNRFYTYEYSAEQSQTNTAMNGFLSSTLSGQLNDLLSSAIGSRNWNFGTTLSTGQMGWSDMDVEGMLSGRLLNNRLLINGTFGYRDTPMANTNFIGDFDVQWLLTPSGNVSLKAYSETNDRYFTKSALTTQGIGILLKKDFYSLRDLFKQK